MRLEKYLDNPEQIKTLKKMFYAILGLLVVADVVMHRAHVTFFWEAIPGFHAVYGLVSTAMIIVVSKFIGHAWLMKREDYYD